MNIDKKDFWMLLIPVLAGFAVPVLAVGFLGFHRNIHQENTFYSLFITLASLMYVFHKTIYKKKYPEKFARITSSFTLIASALFFSCLSASILATAISLIPAPAWFHIGLYVGAPLFVLYVFWKMGFKI